MCMHFFLWPSDHGGPQDGGPQGWMRMKGAMEKIRIGPTFTGQVGTSKFSAVVARGRGGGCWLRPTPPAAHRQPRDGLHRGRGQVALSGPRARRSRCPANARPARPRALAAAAGALVPRPHPPTPTTHRPPTVSLHNPVSLYSPGALRTRIPRGRGASDAPASPAAASPQPHGPAAHRPSTAGACVVARVWWRGGPRLTPPQRRSCAACSTPWTSTSRVA